jgi:hypothetical protein
MSESKINAFSFLLLRKIYFILNKKYYYLPIVKIYLSVAVKNGRNNLTILASKNGRFKELNFFSVNCNRLKP